jgi:hypothetical protein
VVLLPSEHPLYERVSLPQPATSGRQLAQSGRGRRHQRSGDRDVGLNMPLVTELVECTGVLKSGKPRRKTIKHYWCVCDCCGEGTYVVGSGLTKKKGFPDEAPGRACRMTPRCPGRHRKPNLETSP